MKELVATLYGISIDSILKISPKTFKLYSGNEQYILKYHPANNLEAIFSRISMLNLGIFLLPVKSNKGHYLENSPQGYFSLSYYKEDESYLNKDIRLHFYIKALAILHHNSLYEVKVSDGFFEESLNYLEKTIDELKSSLLSRMERVEKEPYHRPSDWYFIFSYDHMLKAITEAKRHLDILESIWAKEATVRLSLTYQNFSYDHILVKDQNIVSLDKMCIAPSIYDLKVLVEEAYVTKIDLSSLFKEYLDIHPLLNYEIEWLLCFLFIPKITFYNDEIKDIEAIFNCLSYLKVVEEFAVKLNKLNSIDESTQN